MNPERLKDDDQTLKPGDSVYVHAPHRNISDPRPIKGECEVVEHFPRHVCGPAVMVRDEHGATTVLERYTILLARKGPTNG